MIYNKLLSGKLLSCKMHGIINLKIVLKMPLTEDINDEKDFDDRNGRHNRLQTE